MIHKILRLFFNTLTADDNHYWFNRDNLMRPIQMQLSQKQKTLTHNMANGSKHCCNLNNSTFTVFINHCGGNSTVKSLF